MASIRTGSIVVDIRGSVGTQTYSRNAGGLFVRERVTPADPGSDEQLACRASMSAVSAAWSATLSEAQREAWRSYAGQHPRNNKWGAPIYISGLAPFLRCNFTRHRLDAAIPFEDPPSAPPLHPPGFTFDAWAVPNYIMPELPPTMYDPPPQQLELFCYAGNQQPPGRNYYSTPYFYLGRELFDGVWRDPPWIMVHPEDLLADKRIWIRLVAQMHDTGEISSPAFANAIIA